VLFEYRYFGNTAVKSSPYATGMSFQPDTSREPTYFTGKLAQRIVFRECISALHDVVVSDLRFKPKDRTQYFEWLARQEQIDWAQIASRKQTVKDQLDAARMELADLQRRHSQRKAPFIQARRKYFDWLFQKSRDAWVVLDPVITVHPDEVFFECFSQDESAYGRVSCGYEVFREIGAFQCGTTNVDYSTQLYDEFQKIRDYKDTSLDLDPQGFGVQTAADSAVGGDTERYREVKIDLPDSWVRGFLQVSAAMTLPGVTFRLHPTDVYNLCFVLRRHKERKGPRSLRFHLENGHPIAIVVEPWGTVVTCARSIYAGISQDVRVWGRRRLLTLERLIPVARSVQVTLLGSGMPSFWLADCGPITYTLGLSGWTSNDWSKEGNFDLLAPRAQVDAATQRSVFEVLGRTWFSTPAKIGAQLGLDPGTVASALGAYTQAGRVMYDLNKQVYRKRELSREPLDLTKLRWANEREANAAELVRGGAIRFRQAQEDPSRNVHVKGGVGKETCSLTLNPDHRLTQGECTCSYFFQNKLRKGPCEHLLALRLAHERGIGDPTPAVMGTQPAPPRTPTERAAPGGIEDEATRFLRLLIERKAIELAPGAFDSFAPVFRATYMRRPKGADRTDPIFDLLMSSDLVSEVFVSKGDLHLLLEAWG
jgi:hypothetical protein